VISERELKKVKQEKESLIIQLFESHAAIDSLKSENTILFETIESLEIKLKEDLLRSLKSMICVQTYVSNKPGMIIDDLGASNSKINSLIIKPVNVEEVKVNVACLDKCKNSCLNDCLKPKSKDSGTQTQGKFDPTYHHCGIVGHIR
jgi:hypothetical protein